MQGILELVKSDNYIIIFNCLIIFLLIGLIMLFILYVRLENKYKKFMKKLGNGKNLEEDLTNYMYKVNKVEKQNSEIINYCQNLDESVDRCLQNVGIVRYNAFKDVGSDLSFAVALLDEKNNGIVFNGIYSREMSNIYAKPIENGKSCYTLSKEELEAIEKATKR